MAVEFEGGVPAGSVVTRLRPHEYLESNRVDEVVLYYPGSETDFGPIELFAKNANVVVSKVIHTDYGHRIGQQTEGDFVPRLDVWNTGRMQRLGPKYFGVAEWHDFWPEDPRSRDHSISPEEAFAFMTYLSRPNAANIEFTFLATEATHTFSVLVRAGIVPTVIVLQNHGWGRNWTSFGGESELWRRAVDLNALPDFLFVADGTDPWPGYEKVSSSYAYPGQMHDHARAIWRRPRCGSLRDRIADWKDFPNELESDSRAKDIVHEVAAALGEAIPRRVSDALDTLGRRSRTREALLLPDCPCEYDRISADVEKAISEIKQYLEERSGQLA